MNTTIKLAKTLNPKKMLKNKKYTGSTGNMFRKSGIKNKHASYTHYIVHTVTISALLLAIKSLHGKYVLILNKVYI